MTFLIGLNKLQLIKNYCHVGSSKRSWVSQNTNFTECFFSNYAIISLDITLLNLKNAANLLMRIYNKWGKALLVVDSNFPLHYNIMNLVVSRYWVGGLISNFRCVTKSKTLRNVRFKFPNILINIPQISYFEDRILSEVSNYPIIYISLKQLNEILISGNYFYTGNKSSVLSTRFYGIMFMRILMLANMRAKKLFIKKFQINKRIFFLYKK